MGQNMTLSSKLDKNDFKIILLHYLRLEFRIISQSKTVLKNKMSHDWPKKCDVIFECPFNIESNERTVKML